MNGIWQSPAPKTVRGMHTRLGVPHEADIEVDTGLELVFKVRTYVCQVCNEYCTDKTAKFAGCEPKRREASPWDGRPRPERGRPQSKEEIGMIPLVAHVSEKLDEWNCRPCVDRHYALVEADENHSEDKDENGRWLCGCSDYHDNVCTLTYGDID